MISKKHLEELKKILIEEYEMNLNDADVQDLGECLVAYFEIMAKVNNQSMNVYADTKTT